MIKTIILLSTIYILSRGISDPDECDEGTIITTTSGKQCCIEGENQCPSAGTLINDEIECGENFSCCQCDKIICTPDCDKFVAGGDSAAFGVKSIIINGDANDPAKIECGGDHSCEAAVFTASYISELNCGGDNSCQNIKVTVNDGSVQNIICGGDFACESAQITINNPSDGFQIECKEPSSCQNMVLTVNVPSGSSVSEFNGFGCEAVSACQGASFTINNNGNNAIIIQELKCEAPAACKHAAFNLQGRVSVDECNCGDQGGCLGAIGISDCFQNLEKLECKETACVGETVTIENPKNDFELICENCQGTIMKIVVNSAAEDGPIRNFKGVKCGDPGACEGALIYIDNQQNGVTINVEKIECNNGINTCKGATFGSIGNGNVIFNEIVCESESCNGCMAKGRSCNSYP